MLLASLVLLKPLRTIEERLKLAHADCDRGTVRVRAFADDVGLFVTLLPLPIIKEGTGTRVINQAFFHHHRTFRVISLLYQYLL